MAAQSVAVADHCCCQGHAASANRVRIDVLVASGPTWCSCESTSSCGVLCRCGKERCLGGSSKYSDGLWKGRTTFPEPSYMLGRRANGSQDPFDAVCVPSRDSHVILAHTARLHEKADGGSSWPTRNAARSSPKAPEPLGSPESLELGKLNATRALRCPSAEGPSRHLRRRRAEPCTDPRTVASRRDLGSCRRPQRLLIGLLFTQTTGPLEKVQRRVDATLLSTAS